MAKEYGKLTEDQFKRLIKELPELRKQEKELEQAIKTASKEKLKELLTDDLPWASMYELTYVECLAWLLLALGAHDKLKAAAQAEDPQEEVLRMMNDEDDDWNGGAGGEFTKTDVIGLATVAQRNLLSIMLFKRSICSMIEEARAGGPNSDSCLLNAIRVDPTVITCPTASKRLAEAAWLGDKRFLIRARSALKGPLKKHWEGYRDLRYSLVLLRDMGLKLSDQELEHLLVKVLKVYPDTPSARKNLRKQYYESQKIKSL